LLNDLGRRWVERRYHANGSNGWIADTKPEVSARECRIALIVRTAAFVGLRLLSADRAGR